MVYRVISCPASLKISGVTSTSFCCLMVIYSSLVNHIVSGIGAVVKVVDSHRCGWGSIPGKSCSFLIVFLSKGLSLCFMCSDQHVKYRMPHEFALTSSLLLNYHVKTIHTHTYTHIHVTKPRCWLAWFQMPFQNDYSECCVVLHTPGLKGVQCKGLSSPSIQVNEAIASFTCISMGGMCVSLTVLNHT